MQRNTPKSSVKSGLRTKTFSGSIYQKLSEMTIDCATKVFQNCHFPLDPFGSIFSQKFPH
jgi:hypothetical protein